MVQAKKSLGQHFLKDENVARKIVNDFLDHAPAGVVVEVGPGTGVLTKYLLQRPEIRFFAVEADVRMVTLLRQKFPMLMQALYYHDFLTFDFGVLNTPSFSIIGNFPYNISSQILFRVYENQQMIPCVVGMFQKEVAQRIAAKEGSKTYGILSVLMQAFYEVHYLFEVQPPCFDPPPKVKSAVIRLQRKPEYPPLENRLFFTELVKAGFNQRRKMLGNSLGGLAPDDRLFKDVSNKRAEQLSVHEWMELSNRLYKNK